MFKIIKNTAVIIIIITAAYFCLVYPSEIGDEVQNAINRCFKIIIQSMFIFLCITSFISASGVHSLIGMPFRFISEKIFHIPKEGFAIFLLSMISGYPAGIKLVTESFKKGDITSKQAKAMECFCCCGGPAFISGTAAAFLYPDSNAASLLFVSIITANILTAFILTRRLPSIKKSSKKSVSIRANQFIPSVKSASSAMLQMCVMIAAFGGICCILKLTGIIDILSYYTNCITGISTDTSKSIIMSFLEISNIVTLPAIQTGLFPIVSFLLSFGGICVILQIAALADSNFNLVNFLIARLFSALISSVISYFLTPFLNIDTPCSSSFSIISESKYSPLPTILLIIMMMMLLGLFGENKKSSD